MAFEWVDLTVFDLGVSATIFDSYEEVDELEDDILPLP